MAIAKSAPGLTVEVTVNERPLPEIEDRETTRSDARVVNYIEALPGALFEVKITFTNIFTQITSHDILAHVQVDGKIINKPIIHSQRLGRRGLVHWSRGLREKDDVGNWSTRPTVFSTLVADSGVATESVERSKGMGEITVDVYVGQVGAEMRGHVPQELEFRERSKVNEKTLKGRAISLTTTLAQARPFNPTFAAFLKLVPNPLATFIFKYRTLADLRAEHIIPRNPSLGPQSAEEDRSIEDMPVEMMRGELKRLLEAEAQWKKAIKRESEMATGNGGALEEDEVEIVEPPAKRRRTVATIDLTGA